MNQTLLPNLCMSWLSQGAVVIDPKTMREIGRVAQQTFEASDWPASPPTVNSIGIWEPIVAWAATRTATLRLSRLEMNDSMARSVVAAAMRRKTEIRVRPRIAG